MCIAVDQRSADVAVSVLDPNRSLIEYIDAFGYGPESFSILAAQSGIYRIKIRTVQAQGRYGHYALRVVHEPRCSADDEAQLQAARSGTEARRLYKVQGPDSLRSAVDKNLESLSLWKRAGDSGAEARTLIKIGDAFDKLQEYSESRKYYEQALALGKDAGQVRVQAEALNNMAMEWWKLGEVPKALDLLEQAQKIWTAGGYLDGQAATLSNLGILYWQTGHWQIALRRFQRAFSLVQSIGNTQGQAFVLHLLGLDYSSLGQNRKAFHYLTLAAPLFHSLEDRVAEARTLTTLGEVCLAMGSIDKAINLNQRALKIVGPVHDRPTEAEILNHLGEAFARLGNLNEASRNYDQALPVFRDLGDPRGEAKVLRNLGQVYASRSENRLALETLQLAAERARTTESPDLEAGILLDMAHLQRQSGNLDLARTLLETALEIMESLRAEIASPESRGSFFATKVPYYKYYIDLLMELHRQDPTNDWEAKAFEAAERTQARGLFELLSDTSQQIRAGLDLGLRAKESQLRAELSFRSQHLANLTGAAGSSERETDRSLIGSLSKSYEELRAQIEAINPQYASVTQVLPSHLAEIQQAIPDQETSLLEYSLGERHSFLWVVTRTAIHSYELPPRSEIEAAAREVTKWLQTKPASTRVYPKAAWALSRAVLGPAISQLAGKRLVIVGDGALHRVSFAALPLSKGFEHQRRGLALASRFEIVSLPSASVMMVLQRSFAGRNPAPRQLAVLADPVFDSRDVRLKRMLASPHPGPAAESAQATPPVSDSSRGVRLARLPFSRREAERILSLVPADSSLKALDFSANKTIAMSAQLARFRMVHFATHSLVDDKDPESSGLILSLIDEHGQPIDGFLHLHDIFNLKLSADLVVLSACETGLGKLVQGEGLMGLTRAFLYAGAARVVVSLWKVDDEATAELMKLFYEAMLGPERLRPAAALRAAQLRMKQQKRWSDPYYWAGFVLTGELR